MRYKKIFSLFFTVAAAILLFYALNFFKNSNNNGSNVSGASTNFAKNINYKNLFAPNPKLEAEYEKAVKEILEKFSKGEKSEKIRDEMLNLKVPGKYRNFQLDIVLIFNAIIQGSKDSDQAIIADAMKKLDEMKESNAWMK